MTTAAKDLPDAVRVRLVALVATCLPEVVSLPPALRRVADFAPARRARAGGAAILLALEDEDVRARVAVQVRVQVPAAEGASVSHPAEAVEAAALAWLLRPEGWEALLADALALVGARDQAPHDRSRLERLQARADEAEQALREQRRVHRSKVDELKAEIATLRRTLGETRTTERTAREASRAELADAEDARVRAEGVAAGLEKEVRRLRAQVGRAEEASLDRRRRARGDRDEATVRARLLLDTIADAATGLQRELALPTATGNPGDRVEGELAVEGAREPSSTGSLSATSPILLEQYLALPRARLIVDGYNVSKASWPTLSLEVQRTRLLTLLASLVARTSAETTVVFDAQLTSLRPVVSAPRGVRVVFSPEGVIADDVIRDLVAAEPPGRVVVVVTGDRAVLADVTRMGARSVAPEALVARRA